MRVGVVLRYALAALAVALAGTSAADAEGPAVAGPNGKFSIQGGEYDGDGSFLALGSVTLPVGTSLGFQLDGAAGEIDDEALWGGGAHLFMRDPDQYLLGVYASYHEWNDIGIWRVAAEGELYLGRFSVEGIAGFESVDVPSFVGGLEVLTQDDDHFFTDVDLAYYPLDDLKLYGGVRYISETTLGAAGAEYLLRQTGVPISLFVEGRFGDDDHDRITGGIKAYFGADPSKSLILRHRTEDPDNYTPTFPNLLVAQPQAPQQSTPTKPPEPETPTCTVNDGIVTGPGTAGTTGNCVCPDGKLPSATFDDRFACGNL